MLICHIVGDVHCILTYMHEPFPLMLFFALRLVLLVATFNTSVLLRYYSHCHHLVGGVLVVHHVVHFPLTSTHHCHFPLVLLVLLLVYRIVSGVDNSLCYMVRFYLCPLLCLVGEALLQLEKKEKKCESFSFLLYIYIYILFFFLFFLCFFFIWNFFLNFIFKVYYWFV